MRMPLISSGLAMAIVLAVGAFFQNQAFAWEKTGLPVAVGEQPIDRVEVGRESGDRGDRVAGRNENGVGATQKTKGGDRKEMDRRDDSLILLLQILRSPR